MPETAAIPSLVDTLAEYIDALPEAEQPDALHQVFYGFYSRVAIIDRATHDLARTAQTDGPDLQTLAPSLIEALRDNALFVGQELFASRVRTMAAMGYVSQRLAAALRGEAPPTPYTFTHAVAFDMATGALRAYALDTPGEHPDLPYDAAAYDPRSS
jgi:hypothetical protein